MFCKNCGVELEDDALFCYACGERNEPEETGAAGQKRADDEATDTPSPAVEEAGETVVEEAGETVAEEAGETVVEEAGDTVIAEAGNTENPQQLFCPNCGCKNDADDMYCKECGMTLAGPSQNTEKKKKVSAGLIGLGAALAAVLVLAVWGITHLMSGNSAETPFLIYDKDNELTAARKNKYEPFVVGDKLLEQEDEYGLGVESFIRYSESGKYLYYPQKRGSSGFDLYRKELIKKNDEGTKLVSKIYDYSLIDENNFVYLKDTGKRKLHLYSKGESEKLASDIEWYQVSGNGKYVLWMSDGDLYVQETKLKASSQKLDSNVSYVAGMSDDLKTIVYHKEDKLYILKGLEDSERIDTDVKNSYVSDVNGSCKIYYLKTDDDSYEEDAPAAEAPAEANSYETAYLSYYDLIEDDLFAQDREIGEPDFEDYEKIVFTGQGEEEREFDDAAFDAALIAFEEKLERDNLRANLSNTRFDMTEWKIYYYEDGKGESSQALTVNVLPGMGIYGGLMEDEALLFTYNVDAGQNVPLKMSELAQMESYEVQSKIKDRVMENAGFLYVRNGQVNEVESASERFFDNVFSDGKKHVVYLSYYEDEREAVYRFDYTEKGAVPELVSDEVEYVVTSQMDKLCYVDEDKTLFYGEQEIDEDVFYVVYDDGKLLYLTDVNDASEGTLKLYEGGKESVEIDEDVMVGSYGLFDGERVAYLTDYSLKRSEGDLGVFAGKEAQIVDTDVKQVFFPKREP